ncbi:MAG TPA: ABC transporter permease [Fulvivirga sp.]|nr:ABC transporter permease [Fulvivirga sp.]
MLKSYLKIALRNFTRRQVYSIVNVVGLSVALACCLLVYLFVKSEFTYDTFHDNYENIYRLNVKTKRSADGDWRELGAVAAAMAPAFAENSAGIDKYVRLKGALALMKVNEEYREVPFIYADPDIFKVFTFPLLRGESKSLFNDPNTAILSEEYALKWFNTLEVVGKTFSVQLNDEYVPITIKGVTKKIPGNSSIQFDILLPFQKFIQTAGGDWLTSWNAWGIPTYFLMKESFNATDFDEQLTKIARKHFPEESRMNYAMSTQPLKDIYLDESVRGFSASGKKSTSWVLLTIAAFIIIIASINYTNLAIGMALPRTKEIGLRKTIGASGRQLAFQFLGEAFLYSIVSLFFALLLADLLLPYFSLLTNTSLDIIGALDYQLVTFIVSLVLLITLMAGGYPALIVSKFNTIKALKGQVRSNKRGLLIKSLIVFQFVLAVIFTFGTYTMTEQINFFYTTDRGYDDQNIIAIYVRDVDGDRVLKRMKEDLVLQPEIASISSMGWTGTRLMVGEGQVAADIYRVDPEFFNTLNIDIIKGSGFSKHASENQANTVIVNRSLLKEIGVALEDAVGTTIPFNRYDGFDNPMIIGVIDDVKFESLHSEVDPLIIHTNNNQELKRIMIKIVEGNRVAGQKKVEQSWANIFTDRPFEFEYLTDINNGQYASDENERIIILSAGFLSVLISCLGLFALSNLSIAQRKKEIGVRKIMGARLPELFITLSARFTLLIAISLIVALPIAWYLASGWLENFAFKIELGAAPFIVITVFMFLLSLISISYQIVKTSNINPAVTLREE